MKWYRKAAEQGYAQAQFNLGGCFYNGQGVEKDAAEAARWYRKAAEQGDDDALRMLQEIAQIVGDKSPSGVQLWENGPYWAECNVGATKPEETGYYFWWGDTVGYKRSNNGWVSVKDGTSFSFSSGNCQTYGKTEDQLKLAGYIDSKGILVARHDAATAHWGAPWRMPTDVEFVELVSNCTTTWTTRNGVYGQLVTGKGAYSSRNIFLPAAGSYNASGLDSLGVLGSYWSSTPSSCSSNDTWCLSFGLGFFCPLCGLRGDGQSVRPVRGFANAKFDALKTKAKKVDVSAQCGLGACHGNGQGVEKDASEEVKWFRKSAEQGDARLPEMLNNSGDKSLSGVQLWENGPYWAECNVGATKPEEPGYYFWWGDTVGYKRNASNDGWVSVKDGTKFSFDTENCQTHGVDLYSDLDANDAATAHWGSPWRMPTGDEVEALISNCTSTWTTRNGVKGRLVTGRGAYSSKSIFLPAASCGDNFNSFDLGTDGCYWSSTPLSNRFPVYAWSINFDSSSFIRSYNFRCVGQTVRPVRGFAR